MDKKLSALRVTDLKEIAKTLSLPGRSKPKNKKDLIKFLVANATKTALNREMKKYQKMKAPSPKKKVPKRKVPKKKKRLPPILEPTMIAGELKLYKCRKGVEDLVLIAVTRRLNYRRSRGEIYIYPLWKQPLSEDESLEKLIKHIAEEICTAAKDFDYKAYTELRRAAEAPSSTADTRKAYTDTLKDMVEVIETFFPTFRALDKDELDYLTEVFFETIFKEEHHHIVLE